MARDARGARAVITPDTLDGISSAVTAAANEGRALRIAGRGSWLDAGGPVTASDVLSLASHSGIVDYVPGDLTITVRAGTPLAEIATATREHGQWLPLDPPGSPDGTIGATVATGSYGPLATAFGRPRDQVLGLESVSGTGEVITVGSRVVKNVAGFDLTRLLVGSWGTLGVITQITLRLRARGDVDRTAAVVIATRGQKLAASLSAARAARLAPAALELLSPAVAGQIGLGKETVLLARFGGNEQGVSAQMYEFATLGESLAAPDDCWDRLRALDAESAATFRCSTPLADLPRAWDALGGTTGADNELPRHATVLRGIIRCLVPAPAGSGQVRHEDLATLMRPVESARMIPERLGQDAWARLAPSPVSDPISRRVKQAFDPANVLNPGILGVVQ
ncbi:MAG: FAD-binding oxidoreductase [Gemmatimonadaceae bacterium]